MVNKLKYWLDISLNIFLITITSISLFLTQVLLLLTLRPFSKIWYTKLTNKTISIFVSLIALISHLFTSTSSKEKTKIILTGHTSLSLLNNNQSAILIANHLSYSDCLYLLILTKLFGKQGIIRFISKESISYVPIFGWACKLCGFIFLKRDWVYDQITITNQLRKQRSDTSSLPILLVMFPEGTIMTKEKLLLGQEFIKSKDDSLNYPFYTCLLPPKTTGLYYCLSNLNPKYLIDVTMGYSNTKIPDQMPQQIYPLYKTMFQKKSAPESVHLHIRIFNLKEIPGIDHDQIDQDFKLDQASKIQFDNWLRQLYKEKDDLLKKFYETGKFDHHKKSIQVKFDADLFDYLRVISINVWISSLIWLIYKLYMFHF
jgi:1-acyl-sn-glycerol-3-phosphate acyltransferase